MASLLNLFVLCALFVITIESRVIKTKRVNVPAEGLTVEIIIKPNRDGDTDLQVKTVRKHKEKHSHKVNTEDAFTRTEDRTFRTTTPRSTLSSTTSTSSTTTTSSFLPKLESRLGIVVGNCPEGYVARGGFCFPDYD